MTDATVLMRHAIRLYKSGRFDAAIEQAELSTRMSPLNTAFMYNLGCMLGGVGRFEEEQRTYRNLLELEPDQYDVLVNLAVSLNETGDFEDSVKFSDRAIRKNPIACFAYQASGIAYQRLGNFETAIDRYYHYIDLKYGLRLMDEDALMLVKTCLALIKIPHAYSSVLEIKSTREKIKECLSQAIRLAECCLPQSRHQEIWREIAFILHTFPIPYQQCDDDLNVLRDFSRLTEILLAIPSAELSVDFGTPCTLGVVSTFRYHTELFIYNQIRSLCSSAFKITLIVLNNPGYRIPIELNQKNYELLSLDLKPETLSIAVQILREKNFKYLFFPEIGMSIESRILASIRLGHHSFTSWLHPVTSGSRYIDWFFSGRTMEPIDSKNQYSERLIRLPGVGLNQLRKDKTENALNQELFKIESPNILKIGCIQNPSKYHPENDWIYAKISKTIPNTRFYFLLGKEKYVNEIFQKRIKEIYFNTGINIETHIVFLDSMNKIDYLGFLAGIDCCLDTFGWSGGNTTMDCLELGIPVFTVPGEKMRSKHTEGIYKTLKEDRFIYRTKEELIRAISDFVEINTKEREDLKKELRIAYENSSIGVGLDRFLNRFERQTQRRADGRF